jgi:hypothetical protein
MPDLTCSVVSRRITITSEFVAFHRWIGAPESVKFLRNYHRHKFGVAVAIDVTHGDRQVEFFTAKDTLDSVIRSHYAKREHDLSCEDMAEGIGRLMVHNGFYVSSVSVSEDGENAGTVNFEVTERRSGQPNAIQELIPREAKVPADRVGPKMPSAEEQVRQVAEVGRQAAAEQEKEMLEFLEDLKQQFAARPYPDYMG